MSSPRMMTELTDNPNPSHGPSPRPNPNPNQSPYYSDIHDGYQMYAPGGGSPAASTNPQSVYAPSSHAGDYANATSMPMKGRQQQQQLPRKQAPDGSQFSSVPLTKKPYREPQEKPSSGPKKSEYGIRHLLSVYADKCSLNGIIFIKTSKYALVKVIWTLLLLGALGVMVYHLYRLAHSYYSYEKQSKVDLKFEKLQFPAVTFCNANAMRQSKMYLASDNLQNLIDEVDPAKMSETAELWNPQYTEFSGSGLEDTSTPGGTRRRRKRSTEDGVTVQNRQTNFLDDYNFTDFDSSSPDYDDGNYRDSWESESEAAAFDQISDQFTNLYSKENSSTRFRMGHQVQDMLVQCSFGGRKCVQSNFSLVATSTLGNCFTIEYSKFVSRQSGPRKGLTLILYLEGNEYIPGISNSKGAQLVVHDLNTIPFPDDEGISVMAGTETFIGLRRVSISRLGNPYGNCTEVGDFKRKYGLKYTRGACLELCRMEQLLKDCSCYDSTRPAIYSLFENLSNACQSDQEKVWCMESLYWDFDNSANMNCKCDSPCSEVQYEKTVSFKAWPTAGFADLIAKTICKEKGRLCTNEGGTELSRREEFVKVNIYFESLNYETMSEEADYTEFQFISDIGGTVGLYVGLSVLSMCEIFHLIISMVKYLCCGHNKKKD